MAFTGLSCCQVKHKLHNHKYLSEEAFFFSARKTPKLEILSQKKHRISHIWCVTAWLEMLHLFTHALGRGNSRDLIAHSSQLCSSPVSMSFASVHW